MPPKIKELKLPAGYIDKPIKTADILACLELKYNNPNDYRREWVGFAEFRPGTGFAACSDRYIDFWAINCFGGQGYDKVSYEIKQSRSDFMSEIKNPEKRKMALLISNKYYFAAPLGLIKPEDLPPEAGLVEFFWQSNQPIIDARIEENRLIEEANALGPNTPIERGSPLYYMRGRRLVSVPPYSESIGEKTTVKAPIREHMVPGWKFIAAVCRRVMVTKQELAKCSQS